MSLAKQLFHILLTFGPSHTARRISQALSAKFNEWIRSLRHVRRIRSLEKDSTLIITCVGKHFEVNPHDFGLHRDLISDRIREPVATSIMLSIAQETDVLLDAGANIGYFSLLLADHCQKVYSIEPDIINLKALERNILLNKTKNIQTFNLALSDNSEPLYLNSSSKSNWHSTTKQADRDSKKISALSVDEFCERENIQPTILKMDIEGFEKYVIPGAKKTLSKLKALFFELHSTHLTLEETNSILDVIEQSGLCLYKVIRYDRPGLWKEESLNIVDLVRKGDYGIYEMIYTTPSQRGPS